MAGSVKLSHKQQRFVDEYLKHWNAHDAAIAAGYSPKSAYLIGSENIRKPYIKALIDERIAELKATADEVMVRLTSHSRGTMDDFIGSMDMIDLDRVRSRGKMHLIKKVKQHTTRISKKDGEDIEYHDIELELYDAQAATVQLAKILGQFIERVEVYDWRKDAESKDLNPEILVEIATAVQSVGGDAKEALAQFIAMIEKAKAERANSDA